MARVLLFTCVILAIVFGVFAMTTGSRRNGGTPPAVLTVDGVPVSASNPIVRNAIVSAGDARMVTFLRQTLVMADARRAEEGQYTKDVRKITHDRPANVDVYVVRVADDGIRMTAVDKPAKRQCDIFSGDSARWAFGYAFDPRRPGCGPLR